MPDNFQKKVGGQHLFGKKVKTNHLNFRVSASLTQKIYGGKQKLTKKTIERFVVCFFARSILIDIHGSPSWCCNRKGES